MMRSEKNNNQPVTNRPGKTGNRDKKRKTMEERRGTMDRKKFGAVLVALVTGMFLSAGSALAVTGYLQGDPAHGKLIPYYHVTPTLSTIIGVSSTEGGSSGPNVGEGDLLVEVNIFNKRSTHIADFSLCLSPADFGFIVLQNLPAVGAQKAEIDQRFGKARVYSVTGDGIPEEGYLTMGVSAEFSSNNGKCSDVEDEDPLTEDHLATWAILQDVASGFFATEIPTATVNIINTTTGRASGGEGAFGLIPGPDQIPGGCDNSFDEFPCLPPPSPSNSNTVIARYDVNPLVQSHTDIYVWLARNAFIVPNDPGSGVTRSSTVLGFLDCEDELRFSVDIPLPDEVNIIDPNTLAGIGQCKLLGQYRGVLNFQMPDTGFLWSQISQSNEHFRETFLGYNLDENWFINDFVFDFD
jgi:hypothetical protein